jgi:hypothetical protein
MLDDIINALVKDTDSPDSKRSPQTNTRFKTLLGYGKLISGLGWILFIAGILMILSLLS